MENITSASMQTKFAKNKFDGDKNDWPQLATEINIALMANSLCGEEGTEYCTTVWPKDVNGDRLMPPHFTVRELPVCLLLLDPATIPTVETRHNEKRWVAINGLNKEFKKIRAACLSILFERCSQHILSRFTEMGCDLNQCYE